jgi:hypothetical protein
VQGRDSFHQIRARVFEMPAKRFSFVSLENFDVRLGEVGAFLQFIRSTHSEFENNSRVVTPFVTRFPFQIDLDDVIQVDDLVPYPNQLRHCHFSFLRRFRGTYRWTVQFSGSRFANSVSVTQWGGGFVKAGLDARVKRRLKALRFP